MMLNLESPLLEAEYVVVDVETTGLKPPEARLTEVAAVQIRNGEIGLELAQLVDPGCPIPPRISEITGITNAMVAGQPSIDAVWPYLRGFIGDSIIVAHNAKFDMSFLDHDCSRLTGEGVPNPELCTVILSRKAWPWMPRHNLDTVASNLGFSFAARHRALGDAKVTAQVLLEALPVMASQGIKTVGDLLRKQRSSRCRDRLIRCL